MNPTQRSISGNGGQWNQKFSRKTFQTLLLLQLLCICNARAATHTKTLLTASAPIIQACGSIDLTVSVTSKLPATATGNVTFADAGQLLGTVPLDTNGIAHFHLDSPAAGRHLYSTSYSGDANFEPSKSMVRRVKVLPQVVTVTVVSDSGPVSAGQYAFFSVYVTEPDGSSCPATGAVILKNGSVVLGNVTLTGSSSSQRLGYPVQTSENASGNYRIFAVYSGDANHKPVTSPPILQPVNPVPHFSPSSLNGHGLTIHWTFGDQNGFYHPADASFSFSGTSGNTSGNFVETQNSSYFGHGNLYGTYTWTRTSGTSGTLVTTVPGLFTHTFNLTFNSAGGGSFSGQADPRSHSTYSYSDRYYSGTFDY
jgi:hypothetical protein